MNAADRIKQRKKEEEKKPKLYIVVSAETFKELEQAVNAKMAKKYIPIGGVATSEIGYVQAMIYKRS